MSRYRFAKAYNATKSRGPSGFWRPKEGEHVLRFLTFNHEVKDRDFKLGRYIPGEVEEGEEMEELYCLNRVHFGFGEGPTPCGLIQAADGSWIGDCEMCDTVNDLRNGNEADQKRARDLSARQSYACNILVLSGDNPMKPMIYQARPSVMDKIMDTLENPRNEKKTFLGPRGRDLYLTFDKTQPPQKMYKCEWADAEDSENLTGQLDESAKDLLDMHLFVPTDFYPLFPKEGEEEEKPKPKARPKKKAARKTKAKAKPKPEPEAEAEPTPLEAAEKAYPVGSSWTIETPDNGASSCEVKGHLEEEGVIYMKVVDEHGDAWEAEASDLEPVAETASDE